MKISTNIHVSTTLVHCMLSKDPRVQQNLTKAFCVNELATWMEFIIKGFVYLIICKFCALYRLYQENNKLKYIYVYSYLIHIHVFISISIYEHTTAYSRSISTA